MSDEFNFDNFWDNQLKSVDATVADYEKKLARARGELKPSFSAQSLQSLEPKIIYLNSNSLGKYKFSLLPTETVGYRCITNIRKLNLPYSVVKTLEVPNLRSSIKSADSSNFPNFTTSSKETINRFNLLFDDVSWHIQDYLDKNLLPKEFNSPSQYGKNLAMMKINFWIVFFAKVYEFPKGVKA